MTIYFLGLHQILTIIYLCKFQKQFQNAVSKCSFKFHYQMHTIECTQSLSVFDRINRLHTIAHMTLSSIHGDVVKVWLSTNNNMTEECRGEEREDLRNELKALDKREISIRSSQILTKLLGWIRTGLRNKSNVDSLRC